MNSYYLYRHIRNDTNEPFYIGIGTKNDTAIYQCKIYKRAYFKSKSKRSMFWTNVFRSCGFDITIEILFETFDINIIKEKEKEFIKLYGRRDLKLGTLVNQTDGGDGINSFQWSEESKKRRSDLFKINNPFKGKKHSLETKKILSEKAKDQYLNGNSGIKGFKHTNETKNKLSVIGKDRALKGKLPILVPKKGSDNYFSKDFICISPNNEVFNVSGGIKSFCQEKNLSYDYVKKFTNKGRCLNVDPSRLREKSRNTIGWEFKTVNN